MINWDEIRLNYPEAFKDYMKKRYSLSDFWSAYNIYVNIRVLEEKTGNEYWDFKLESKLIMYSSIALKTLNKDGKKISIYNRKQMLMRQINNIFDAIELQIKNNNYLNN